MPGSRGRRFIPFLLALVVLAWSLGSVPRSQPGGSWLVNSYWLLYLIAFLPVLAIIGMLVMIGILVYSWRTMSDALGAGMAKKTQQKKNRLRHTVVALVAWGLALSLLLYKCGGIPCRPSPAPLLNIQSQIAPVTASVAAGPIATITGATLTITSIVQSEWFTYGFLGLLVISSAIFARSFMVGLREMRTDAQRMILFAKQKGLKAVQEAILIVQESVALDPRERVLASYNRMIGASASMGANVTPDQTARELERTIRVTFMLRGGGIRELTTLFEEARYSIHPMTEADSERAYQALVSIEAELVPQDVKPSL